MLPFDTGGPRNTSQSIVLFFVLSEASTFLMLFLEIISKLTLLPTVHKSIRDFPFYTSRVSACRHALEEVTRFEPP